MPLGTKEKLGIVRLSGVVSYLPGQGLTSQQKQDARDNTESVWRGGDTMTGPLLLSGTRLDSTETGSSDILNIGTQNADIINIGNSGAIVNIEGTLSYQNVENLEVTDKLITLNKGGGVATAIGAGIELEEDSIITGHFKTDGVRMGWLLKAPASQELQISLASLTTGQTVNFQDASGSVALINSGFTDPRYALISHATDHLDGGSDEIAGESLSVNITPAVVNYTPVTTTLKGHLDGIDNALGTLSNTTASLLARIYFQGDTTVVNSITYFVVNIGDPGTVSSASPTPLVLDDNQNAYFGRDLVSPVFPFDNIVPAGLFAGSITVKATGSNAPLHKYEVEIWRADGLASPTELIATMSTGNVALTSGVKTTLGMSTELLTQKTILAGERFLYRVRAYKVGTQGATWTYEVFYGFNENTHYDIPILPTTDTVENTSSVISGGTATGALEHLDSAKEETANKVTNFSTINNTLFPTTQAVVNKFITLDTNQTNISGQKTFTAGFLTRFNFGVAIGDSLNPTSYGELTYIDVNKIFSLEPTTGFAASLRLDALTASRSYTFQNKPGTLAHLDDITSAISGTTNTIPKFTGANTIGNSQLTDDGTTLGLTTNWSILSSGILQSNGAQTIQTSGTEALTLQGNGGNIGIGGSPQTVLDVFKDGVDTATSPKIRITNIHTSIDAGNDFGSLEWFSNDLSANGTGISGFIKNIAINAGVTSALTFGVRDGLSGDNAVEKLRLIENGNLLIGTTTDTGEKLQVNGLVKTDGVKFPSTQVPSADVNTLDDYEEGEYTATMTPETSGTITLSSTVDTLSYTKIGRKVTVIGLLQVSSVSSPVGSFVEINLPFSSANLTESAGVSVTFLFYGSTVGSNSVVASVVESSSNVRLFIDASTIPTGSPAGNFYINLNYFTA